MPGSYGGWAGQPPPGAPRGGPSGPELFDQRPVYPQQHPSMAVMGGLQRRKQALKPWMLVVGALVMAALAFAITRAFLS